MTTWSDIPAGAGDAARAAPAGDHGGWRGLARRLAASITWNVPIR